MDQQEIITDLEGRAKAVGLTIAEVCSRAELHPTTFSRWKLSEKNTKPVGANLASISRLRSVIEEAEAAAASQPKPAPTPQADAA